MGTVKYTGPVASFHCPTNAEIRSLKVHFSPKQLGEGDPSPENVRPIEGWDGVSVHNDDGIVVPEEYQKVEYIESNGAQYLNTQINGVSGLNIECILMLNSNANITNCGMIGSRENSDATRFYAISFYQNKWHVGMPNDSSYREVLTQVKYKARLETSSTRYVLYVNDEVYGSLNSHQDTTYPLYVFACNNYGTAARGCSGRVYSVLIDNGTTKLFNGIPCRRKSDNKPGMYDTVSGEFFTNQGTGEFICGPDVRETVKYEFGVLGKNKLDPTWESGGINVSTGEASTDSASIRLKNMIKVFPSQTYRLSWSSTGRNIYRFAYKKDGTFSRYLGLQSVNSQSITLNADEYYLWLYQYQNINEPENIQLELGSTATAYEPYDPKHTVYGGWVDLVSGEVQEDGINGYPYYSIVLNGTEEWTLVKQDNEASIFKYYYGVSAKTEAYSICSHFKMILPSYTTLNCHNGFVHGMSGNLFIQPVNSIASKVEEFQTYLASQYQNGTPVTVLFQANKTPNTYHLTSTQLQTFLGQNNVWSNADYVEVEYDLHETQSILARKQFIVANQPHIVKPAAAPIQTFTTDVPAPLKECKIYFNPVQEGSGDPSPENVREIRGWDDCKIIRCGENIFHTEWEQGTIIGTTNKLSNSDTRLRTKDYIKLKTGTRYVINVVTNKSNAILRTFYMYKDDDTLTNYSMAKEPFPVVTTPQSNNNNYVKIKLVINYSTDTTPISPTDIISTTIEAIPSGVPDYKPYNGTTIPITFPSEAGTIYGGYVDLSNNELVQTHYKLTFDGTETVMQVTDKSSSSITPLTYVNFDSSSNNKIARALNGSEQSQTMTSFYSHGQYALSTNEQTYHGFAADTVNHTQTIVGLFLPCGTSDIANYLSTQYNNNTPVEICYPLLSPIHYSLSLTQLKTLRGTNNIWSSANGDIELAYWTH